MTFTQPCQPASESFASSTDMVCWDFIALQEKLAALDVEAVVADPFKIAEMLEGQKTQLDIDRANIRQRLQE